MRKQLDRGPRLGVASVFRGSLFDSMHGYGH
jgi:hypothetical protein